MKLIRHALAALAAVAAFAGHAQDYPNKTIRIVVPYAAGGGVDQAARVVAQHLTTALGQQVIVEPKPGGGTVLGTEHVARAAPDGYTLLLTGGSTMSLLPLCDEPAGVHAAARGAGAAAEAAPDQVPRRAGTQR